MENENESIKSLLRTTLEWARLLKVKFRFNADTLSKHLANICSDRQDEFALLANPPWAIEDFVREWGYDIDGLIDDLQEFDVPIEANITFENGDFISWELWNTYTTCAVDYSISFLDYDKLRDDWTEVLIKFKNGLL